MTSPVLKLAPASNNAKSQVEGHCNDSETYRQYWMPFSVEKAERIGGGKDDVEMCGFGRCFYTVPKPFQVPKDKPNSCSTRVAMTRPKTIHEALQVPDPVQIELNLYVLWPADELQLVIYCR
jgi:hypothetical protein